MAHSQTALKNADLEPPHMPVAAASAVVLASLLAAVGLLRIGAGHWTPAARASAPDVASALVPAVAVGLALLLRRHWPWLLLVGGALNLVLIVAPRPAHDQAALDTAETLAATVVTPVVVVGVLVAVEHLVRQGRTLPGVLLGAAVFVAIAFDFDFARFAAPQADPGAAGDAVPIPGWILALLGLAGGVIAVVAWGARWPVTEPATPTESGDVLTGIGRWRCAVIGLIAAGLPVIDEFAFRVLPQSDGASGATTVLATGAFFALAALVLSAVAGWRALAWTVTVALALVGVRFATGAGMQVARHTGEPLLPAMLVGLLAGLAFALWRFRPLVAAAGCVVIMLALHLLHKAVAGDPAILGRNAERVPNFGFVAIVTVTLVLVGGAAVASLARRRGVAVVLLPLVAVAVIGAQRLRTWYMASGIGDGRGGFTGGTTGDIVGSNIVTVEIALGGAVVLLVVLTAVMALASRPTASDIPDPRQ